MSKQYHIAQKGKNAGKLVPCYAKHCTIGNVSDNTSTITDDNYYLNLDNATIQTDKVDFYNLAANYANSRSSAKHIALASDHRTPSRMLAKIFETTEDTYALHLVAKHPNTPTHIVKRLSLSEDFFIQQGAVENFKCPDMDLERVIKLNHDSIVREKARTTWALKANPTEPLSIALNPKSSAKKLDALKDTPNGLDESVTYIVAKHPNTSPETLRHISAKNDPWSQVGVAGNPNTPQDVLTELAKSSSGVIRTEVYYNSNTPEDVRKTITPVFDEDTLKYISPSFYTAKEKTRELNKTVL
jgi:hypothetical protein